MADLRILPGAPSSGGLPARSPARAEAVQAAQRAFFQAALTQAQSPAVAAPAARPARAAQAASSFAAAAGPEDAGPAGRIRRPGSFVDIKV